MKKLQGKSLWHVFFFPVIGSRTILSKEAADECLEHTDHSQNPISGERHVMAVQPWCLPANTLPSQRAYLMTEMFPIFLNIPSLEKCSLYQRSTETISLVLLLALQIWDFLGGIIFTYKRHYVK